MAATGAGAAVEGRRDPRHRAVTAPRGGNAAELKRVHRWKGGRPALDGLSLGIPAGALTAVLGPSGCGKTTLLRVLAGLEDPDEGEVVLHGATVADPASRVEARARGVALVFQDLALWPHMTVRENVEFPLETSVADAARRRAMADRAADLVRISHRMEAAPGELSGGERQRAALARALAGEPRLLLLDEPFSGLDAVLRMRLLEAVAEVRARLGIAAVLVTHDQAEALGAADRVVVMREGRVAQEGPAEEVYARPRGRFVASFVGLASFLPGTDAGGGVARTAAGEIPYEGRPAADGRVLLASRPEEVALDPAAPLRGTVLRSLYRGDGWLASVEVAGGRILARAAAALAPGTEVGLRFLAPPRAVEDDGEDRGRGDGPPEGPPGGGTRA